ncbi:MAG: histidine kinase dimerization/phosphoacceptor domain -containing protein [Phenylobacterium sp.]|uniref:sensor histidine kinase n=1 Tax=Phenylobacterium sp. TaxID=1871053 RepID=UPI00271DE2D6|nr:PAS domain-containing sensor histidine kinase [Phenylobacterium sp.]MDO8913541.1 histidine kinase dimerization/phosphoacceptor domain -containing protein [Phenylobacterium sp.]MDP3102426.1 histidine kinase dimerization/phosphoacceptor domain -containing protein [Phenylobacterium sp.]
MAAQTPHYSEEAALSLTLAIVAASQAPLLLLDGDLNIVSASQSFGQVFELDVDRAVGGPLSSLGAGEWEMPRLRALLDATAAGDAPVDAFELDLVRPGRSPRHLLIHAQRLVYLDLENRRLLMSVTDTTQALADQKLKDDALAENQVLLSEVRHRVANSLQIIASVLLQNARRTQSEETRSHLKDAHNRVMSVAALERQLSESAAETVQLQTYFISLCDSIAASMIADPERISLRVTGEGGMVSARISVSLGLIVTELVINALKHAFPDGRSGKIVVDCQVHGPNWTLSVTDDGAGLLAQPSQGRIGLGTSIVQALARQLDAVVEIKSAHPGTSVTVTHTQVALVQDLPADGQAAASL